MTTATQPDRPGERSGNRIDKFAERRKELAAAAVQTLSELGYARTSLREIAQNSEYSHGVLHYYFRDKVDLITCCVRHYKERRVARYDRVTARAASYDELARTFVDSVAATMREEAHLHRLWYDLRAQALFEASFRAEVVAIDKSIEDMIARIVSRLHELAGETQTLPHALVYALVDGVFQQSLLTFIAGDSEAIDVLKTNLRALLDRIVLPRGRSIGAGA
jgi:AcrR family transcriptional regulator